MLDSPEGLVPVEVRPGWIKDDEGNWIVDPTVIIKPTQFKPPEDIRYSNIKFLIDSVYYLDGINPTKFKAGEIYTLPIINVQELSRNGLGIEVKINRSEIEIKSTKVKSKNKKNKQCQ